MNCSMGQSDEGMEGEGGTTLFACRLKSIYSDIQDL